jgi:hypothetical protein
MPDDLRPIINDIADRAEDFLGGTKDRAQARAGISELLTIEHPQMAPDDRKLVTKEVMAILEEEDFFGTEFVGGIFDDDDSEED